MVSHFLLEQKYSLLEKENNSLFTMVLGVLTLVQQLYVVYFCNTGVASSLRECTVCTVVSLLLLLLDFFILSYCNIETNILWRKHELLARGERERQSPREKERRTFDARPTIHSAPQTFPFIIKFELSQNQLNAAAVVNKLNFN